MHTPSLPKVRQIVLIFRDPFTRERPEGLARILAHEKSYPDGSSLYCVNFLIDQPHVKVHRVIAPR